MDLVKQKWFHPYECMSDSEKKLHSKEKFYSSLTDRKISDQEYECVLKVNKSVYIA